MKKSGDKRRWWQFGGWLKHVPEPETDMHKVRGRSRLYVMGAAVLAVISAGLMFNYEERGDFLASLAVLHGVVWAAFLTASFFINARLAKRWHVRVLMLFSILAGSVGMMLLCQGEGAVGLLLALCGTAGYVVLSWKFASPAPASPGMLRLSHLVFAAGRDLVKGALFLFFGLYLLFLVSTPFRPLAIQPPPPELLARYPQKPFVPRGDGEATRLFRALDPDYLHMVSTNNPINLELRAKWDALPRDKMAELRTNRWQNVAGKKGNEALDAVAPLIDGLIKEASQEDVQRSHVVINERPFAVYYPSWAHCLRYLILSCARRIDSGGERDAEVEIRKIGELGAFATRSSAFIDGLVGRLLAGEILLKLSVRLVESHTVGAMEAENRLDLLQRLPERFGSPAQMMDEESTHWEALWRFMSSRRLEMLKAALSAQGWQRFCLRYGLEGFSQQPEQALQWFLGLNPLSGNDLQGVRASSANRLAWMHVLAEAALDPLGPDMEIIRKAQEAAASTPVWRTMLKRGWYVSSDVTGSYLFASGSEWKCRANLALARAAVMLGAYRTSAGLEAESLETVASRFGWTVPAVPLTDRKVTYLRYPQETGTNTQASAYLLACWGDGRAVPKDCGTALLVVRNPAFGALPFRQYHWFRIKKENDGLDPATAGVEWVASEPSAQRSTLSPRSLKLPLGLLGSDPAEWAKAEYFLKNSGWTDGI